MSERSEKRLIKQIAEELDTFDIMLSALVELLEEKDLLTQEEWETKIKSKIEKRSKSKDYRDIQFSEEET